MRDTIKKINSHGKSFSTGLFEFLKKYSVIGLAIGVITADASKGLVDALVKGIFTPFIKLIVPGDFTNLIFTVRGVEFDIGGILSSLLTFIIIMTFLYFIIKTLLKNDDLLEKK